MPVKPEGNDTPPGPEDVKHFDILEFVKEQENEGSEMNSGSSEEGNTKES